MTTLRLLCKFSQLWKKALLLKAALIYWSFRRMASVLKLWYFILTTLTSDHALLQRFYTVLNFANGTLPRDFNLFLKLPAHAAPSSPAHGDDDDDDDGSESGSSNNSGDSRDNNNHHHSSSRKCCCQLVNARVRGGIYGLAVTFEAASRWRCLNECFLCAEHETPSSECWSEIYFQTELFWAVDFPLPHAAAAGVVVRFALKKSAFAFLLNWFLKSCFPRKTQRISGINQKEPTARAISFFSHTNQSLCSDVCLTLYEWKPLKWLFSQALSMPTVLKPHVISFV